MINVLFNIIYEDLLEINLFLKWYNRLVLKPD